MKSDERDDEMLRAAFAELRTEDLQAVPDFKAVIAKGPVHDDGSRAVAWPLLRLAAAAVVIFALGTTYRAVVARGSKLTVPREVLALSTWQSATGVLLETSFNDFLRHTPKLGASLLDTSTGDLR
jgi:hypothetical protein